ncbi:ABC-type metal ion transport system, ATPase component [Cylindrospermum stagnale PCC 7417]|uniref:ABC-type metal ion transport system, ATPase component n=1 Tax=Cylindrospermum stagnale PCC 7417 TaxID=56107 RepID=K9WX10_9NOST|nr:NIL domain-containing protein [Cylindrospermum stagnale]AFZ24910.1 ABC-type metal ion transport system, ATPase component [Cylindrospermum stagnale PCC 7417]
MTAFNNVQLTVGARLSLVPSVEDKSQITQTRLRLHIPQSYLQEPVISQLISAHDLVVNITGAMLQADKGGGGYFDLELRGTVPQICSGLAYLESLNLKIFGKPNADSDAWYY